ncbi:MAG: YqcC family protein [Gammaproteobacteria bacterium]|nr:YqcC family protein [Gammaproteobacteria bacterium]
MQYPDSYQRINALLAAMQQEMERIGIWEENAPPVENLASSQPFCYDTLHVGQWLQWIFIPRMQTIVDQRFRIPQRCDIHPYAAESLEGYTIDSVTLLSLIREIDGVITDAKHEE